MSKVQEATEMESSGCPVRKTMKFIWFGVKPANTLVWTLELNYSVMIPVLPVSFYQYNITYYLLLKTIKANYTGIRCRQVILKRVNSVCCFLMGLEARALREAFPTQRALVGFLPTVNHCVPDEVALFGEAPAALQAAERLLPRVAPQVLFELTEPHEAFVAVRAAEPLLAKAGPPGRPHPPRQAEAAAALPAERSCCCVWWR